MPDVSLDTKLLLLLQAHLKIKLKISDDGESLKMALLWKVNDDINTTISESNSITFENKKKLFNIKFRD